ncbi:MAG: hypothetical protein GY768_27095 [Planctomycetaceae bacterium]|nr:hypothetical protein [Planctomycetaceae bacterium]
MSQPVTFSQIELDSVILFSFVFDYDMFSGDQFSFRDGYLRSWGRVYDICFKIPNSMIRDTAVLQTYQLFSWFEGEEREKLKELFDESTYARLLQRASVFDERSTDQVVQAKTDFDKLYSVGAFKMRLGVIQSRLVDPTNMNDEVFESQFSNLQTLAKGAALYRIIKDARAAPSK